MNLTTATAAPGITSPARGNTVIDRLIAEYGLSEEDIRAIMELVQLQGQQPLLAGDVAYGEQMAGSPMPRGAYGRGMYLPPSPMQQAAAGVRIGLGTMERIRARNRQEEVLRKIRDARLRGLGVQLPTSPSV